MPPDPAAEERGLSAEAHAAAFASQPHRGREEISTFFAAAFAAPFSSPSSTASSCRCTAVTARCCRSATAAFLSALMRRSTEVGIEPRAKSRIAPMRNSSTPAAQSPSVSRRLESPFSVPSASLVAFLDMSRSPPPVASMKSTYFGRPSLVVRSPAAARSQPVSRTATSVPRPSAAGDFESRAPTPVSVFGSADGDSAMPR